MFMLAKKTLRATRAPASLHTALQRAPKAHRVGAGPQHSRRRPCGLHTGPCDACNGIGAGPQATACEACAAKARGKAHQEKQIPEQ